MYREPGIKITQQKNTSFIGAVGSNLPVCVIGSGPATLTKTFKIVKTDEVYSVIKDSDGDYVEISSIVRIGDTAAATSYNTGDHLTDYTLGSQTIDSVSVDTIEWTGEAGDEMPIEGDTFYATVVMVPADKHYELQSFSTKSAVIAELGDDVIDGVVNAISLAAQIALENTSPVYVKKARKAGSDITLSEFALALSEIKSNSDIYRIIPVDGPKADLNLATVQHVNLMSDPEEASERVTLIGAEHSSSTVTDVHANVGGYAAALGEYRVGVIYPDKATRTLTDGNTYQLGAGFIATALASLKATINPEDAYTGRNIYNFISLVGVAMTRSQKNTLANNGVMILDQEKSGYPITVRHGVSTNMSNIQMREISVTELADYVSRNIRPALTVYKGKNITKSLLTQIEGSIVSILGTLTRQGHILEGSRVTLIQQDPDNPDTVYVEMRVNVPYPCNYIDIVVAYE